MSVDLDDYVDVLKREVNPPGQSVFAAATDDDWIGYLADAFWEARLDGFLEHYVCDEDGVVTPVGAGSDELPRQFVALIVLYAGVRILRNRILNTNTVFRAKAGATEFERQNSATMLAEMLKQLSAAKAKVIAQIENGVTPSYSFDAFSTRMLSPASYYGSPELTES